jgi:carboxypeptidase D
MATLAATAQKCGYEGYLSEYVTYPPRGLLPLPGNSTRASRGCNIWNMIFDAALDINPAFNEYRIFDVVRDFYSPFPTIRRG